MIGHAKIAKNEVEDILALTPMQEGMLFSYLENPQDDAYFEQLCLSINCEINHKIFKDLDGRRKLPMSRK